MTNKDIEKMIIPLMLEQLLAVSVGMVDTLMVSTLGEAAISGVALVDNLNRLVVQVMAAFAAGGVVICSQYYGREDRQNAIKVCGQLQTVMMIFSAITALLLCLFNRHVLSFVFGSVAADVMSAATTYLFITALSYPFLGMYNAGTAIYRSVGNSKISMNISLLMNIVNIALNALFVFVVGLGVMGVALATLISRIAGAAVMEYYVLSHKNPLKISDNRLYKPVKRHIMQILRIAVPSGIENGMFQIGKLAVASMVAKLGTDAIAANAVGYQIIDFPNIPAASIGLALVTVAGQSIGAGDIKNARRQTKRLLGYAYAGDWVCNGALFLFAPKIVSIFSLTAGTAATTVILLRCFAVASLIGWPLSFALPNTLRAAGDVKYTMTVSIASMWLFRIITSYVLVTVFKVGVIGVWIGMFVDWYARGIAYLTRYLSHKWENIDLIG